MLRNVRMSFKKHSENLRKLITELLNPIIFFKQRFPLYKISGLYRQKMALRTRRFLLGSQETGDCPVAFLTLWRSYQAQGHDKETLNWRVRIIVNKLKNSFSNQYTFERFVQPCDQNVSTWPHACSHINGRIHATVHWVLSTQCSKQIR